jgi:cysteine desulfurase / selenocysteine lyase
VAIDLGRARAETPGCSEVVHFTNAGAALPPQPVLNAMLGHLDLEARIGGYEAAERAQADLQRVYASIARLLNCSSAELALVESATRAWDMAFYALPFAPGDRILTSRAEYASNYIALLQVARRTGAVIEVIPDDATGQVSLDALGRAIDGARLVALTHVPTNGGLVNPAVEVGHLARAAGVLYLLDACQSVGQMLIDVEAIGCDMLSATGRKFLRAPRGTGFLYVRQALLEQLEPPFLDLHAATWTAPDSYEVRPDAQRFEAWESSIAARLGLGAAVDYALGWGLGAIRERVFALAAELRTRLAAMAGLSVHDRGSQQCGIVTFTLQQQPAAAVRQALARQAINVWVSPIEYARLDRQTQDVVRASVHYYNTEAEVDRFCAVIHSAAEG